MPSCQHPFCYFQSSASHGSHERALLKSHHLQTRR
uniref:Uncharacterized protein n=1 Tax=Anguilla anguilla TaxID=7936 RepID=A0A0E9W140_ANGAN